MIPPTLAEFRALMQRVADGSSYLVDGWHEDKLTPPDEEAIRALATATPEQLLGIVGTVDCAADVESIDGQQRTATYIVTVVTPREDA